MKGFWGQSEYEIAMLKEDGYCTADRAMTNRRGEITLLGPMEETLNIRGHKVNLAEVEAVLRRHLRVAECAVVALLDATGGFETENPRLCGADGQGRPADRARAQGLLPEFPALLQAARAHSSSAGASQIRGRPNCEGVTQSGRAGRGEQGIGKAGERSS